MDKLLTRPTGNLPVLYPDASSRVCCSAFGLEEHTVASNVLSVTRYR